MQVRPRLWKQDIENYDIEETEDKLVLHTLARKLKDPSYKPYIKEDIFYKQFEMKEITDLELLVKDPEIYHKLECKHLRKLSFKLINIAKKNKNLLEELINLRYQVNKKNKEQKTEEFQKFMILTHDFISRRMKMDTMFNKLREIINQIFIGTEKDWNFLKRLYGIVNKSFKAI